MTKDPINKLNRVDKVLVEIGLAPTRSQALLLIEEGVVFYQNKIVLKASMSVTKDGLEVRKAEQFVSRGAHKIEGALNYFNVNVSNLIIADVGASTGGFTDYVLSRGAKKVYAIDVGHDQLALKLRSDPRVKNYEGINIKTSFLLEEKVDLAVVDLSFISLKLVLKNILALLNSNGSVIALVKPQFEVGRSGIDKNGIVKNEELREKTVLDLKQWCELNRIKVIDQCLSPIKGKTGNVEYFFLLKLSNEEFQ